jgi:hypothetical protein
MQILDLVDEFFPVCAGGYAETQWPGEPVALMAQDEQAPLTCAYLGVKQNPHP